MERRVGKIFAVTIENVVYKCKVTESGFSCQDCAFHDKCNNIIRHKTGMCSKDKRKDNKWVNFHLIKSKNIAQ